MALNHGEVFRKLEDSDIIGVASNEISPWSSCSDLKLLELFTNLGSRALSSGEMTAEWRFVWVLATGTVDLCFSAGWPTRLWGLWSQGLGPLLRRLDYLKMGEEEDSVPFSLAPPRAALFLEEGIPAVSFPEPQIS